MAFDILDMLKNEFKTELEGESRQDPLAALMGQSIGWNGKPNIPGSMSLGDPSMSAEQQIGQSQQKQNPGVNYTQDSRKGIGKFLGDIADTLLMLDGGQPAFKQANQRERASQVLQSGGDPKSIISQLLGIDPALGQEYQEKQREYELKGQAEARQQGTANLTGRETIADTHNKSLEAISRLLKSSDDPIVRAQLANKANAFAKQQGIDLEIPTDYNDEFIDGIGMSANERGRLGELQEHNRTTELQGARRNQISAANAMSSAANAQSGASRATSTAAGALGTAAKIPSQIGATERSNRGKGAAPTSKAATPPPNFKPRQRGDTLKQDGVVKFVSPDGKSWQPVGN